MKGYQHLNLGYEETKVCSRISARAGGKEFEESSSSGGSRVTVAPLPRLVDEKGAAPGRRRQRTEKQKAD